MERAACWCLAREVGPIERVLESRTTKCSSAFVRSIPHEYRVLENDRLTMERTKRTSRPPTRRSRRLQAHALRHPQTLLRQALERRTSSLEPVALKLTHNTDTTHTHTPRGFPPHSRAKATRARARYCVSTRAGALLLENSAHSSRVATAMRLSAPRDPPALSRTHRIISSTPALSTYIKHTRSFSAHFLVQSR